MREYLRGRGIVAIVVVVMLGLFALTQLMSRYAETVGVDFYQFWGVPTAMRLTGGTLGTPYTSGERYHAVLKEYAAASGQPKLRVAHRFWSGPDFAGSPLLYRVFALTSADYTASLGVFHLLQVVSFVGACLLLGYLFRFDPFQLLCLTLVCLLFYQPLLSDLRVGNVGSLQLGALAAALGLASLLPRLPSPGQRAGLGALLLIALAALTLCKPNIVLVAVLLALHLAVRHGVRVFGLAALPAAAATVLLVIAPCVYFRSWTVWQEWYRFVYGANPRMLLRPIASGNYSTPLMLSSWLGGAVWVIVGVLLVLLALSLLAVVWTRLPAPRGAGDLVPRGAGDRVRSALERLLGDPAAALAIGILVTTATSPLYWAHYYVLLLLPGLWLLGTPAATPVVPTLAALGVVMGAGIVGMLLWAAGGATAMAATIALSWVPLWGALLIHLRSAGTVVPEPAAADAATAARRPRRRRK
jgi:hypothetical protein